MRRRLTGIVSESSYDFIYISMNIGVMKYFGFKQFELLFRWEFTVE